jgi:hypothetical protein
MIDKSISQETKAIEYGIPLHFTSREKEWKLARILKEHGFDPLTYITCINDGDCLLDYRIFALLYDQITAHVFDAENGPINLQDTMHAQYLKREGRETYTYYSDDQLIAAVGKITYEQSTTAPRFVLCPISAAHNKCISRLCYEEILRSSLDIFDTSGYAVDIKEGKRIIHFAKMPIDQALGVYHNIVATNPTRYTNIEQLITQLQQLESEKTKETLYE